MEKENIILTKSKSFALRIIQLYIYLKDKRKEYILSSQTLRSGTSIGANAHEASVAQSRKDFLAKMYIALKETAETKYWLELLHESGYITHRQFNSIYADCYELYRILSAITKTTKEKVQVRNLQ